MLDHGSTTGEWCVAVRAQGIFEFLLGLEGAVGISGKETGGGKVLQRAVGHGLFQRNFSHNLNSKLCQSSRIFDFRILAGVRRNVETSMVKAEDD